MKRKDQSQTKLDPIYTLLWRKDLQYTVLKDPHLEPPELRNGVWTPRPSPKKAKAEDKVLLISRAIRYGQEHPSQQISVDEDRFKEHMGVWRADCLLSGFLVQ